MVQLNIVAGTSVKIPTPQVFQQSAIQQQASALTAPKFKANQLVSFIGGIGFIKNRQAGASGWLYAIEMVLDAAVPTLRRGSSGITILLYETDIKVVNSSFCTPT
ncbi:MAG: hypothetical protein HC866_04065 [Leptolyngbyaceae cyanobacterium RU_5_1]|nr:hypothetical protein [Leptolyngbyaceae cyanobacterium RU_5_1]